MHIVSCISEMRIQVLDLFPIGLKSRGVHCKEVTTELLVGDAKETCSSASVSAFPAVSEHEV